MVDKNTRHDNSYENESIIFPTILWSYNVAYLPCFTHNVKSHVTQHFFPSEKSQSNIITLLKNMYQNRNKTLNIEWSSQNAVSKQHHDIPFLHAYVNAIIDINGVQKPIRINSRTKYKYNDALDHKLSSYNLIEMYVCMECFDVPEIDYVKYRGDNSISISTVKRNTEWFNHYFSKFHKLKDMMSHDNTFDMVTTG